MLWSRIARDPYPTSPYRAPWTVAVVDETDRTTWTAVGTTPTTTYNRWNYPLVTRPAYRTCML